MPERVLAPQRKPLVDEYSRLANSYDRKWLAYVEASTRETLARLNLKNTDRILDVGCGTGALLYQLSRRVPQARLVGVDAVVAMLNVARPRLPATVELRQAWADELPYDDYSFDVVLSCSVLHYFPDPLAVLREMRRVLRANGQFVITDWCGDYLVSWIRTLYIRKLSPAYVKTYSRRELVRMLEQAGLEEIEIERYKINPWWGLMTATGTKPG
jgi:ubiquinone/menaquinone biosynthesis C-methylase UbiE